MKTINLITFLISFIINVSPAQTVRVPLVKEKHAVDLLIENYKQRNKGTGVKNDSCFVIQIIADSISRLYSVFYPDSIYNSTVIIPILAHNLKTEKFKYFTYKNNLVFVVGDDDLFNLFAPTLKNRLFAFKLIEKSIGEQLSTIGMGYAYVYENSRFRLLGAAR